MAGPQFIVDFLASLPEEDRERLRLVLGVDEGAEDSTVAERLVPFAAAALAEYVDQFTGRQLPSRIKDQHQLRLLHITRYALAGRLPSPDKVAEMFQLNPAEARSLLRNTATRYRYELAAAMNEAAWDVLTTRAKSAGDDVWNVEIRDLALLEHIMDAVRRGPGNPRGIERSRDEMHVYALDRPTMNSLLASLGKTYDEFVSARK